MRRAPASRPPVRAVVFVLFLLLAGLGLPVAWSTGLAGPSQRSAAPERPGAPGEGVELAQYFGNRNAGGWDDGYPPRYRTYRRYQRRRPQPRPRYGYGNARGYPGYRPRLRRYRLYPLPSVPVAPPVQGVPVGVPGYRTLCVRTCDGFYFPISFSTSQSRFGQDAAQCRKRCGGKVRLYVHAQPAGGPETMVDLRGQPYAMLANAFRYRKELVEGCQCRPAPWTEAEKKRHETYAVAAKRAKAKKRWVAKRKRRWVRKRRVRNSFARRRTYVRGYRYRTWRR